MVKPAAKLQHWKQVRKHVLSMTPNQKTGGPCAPSGSYKMQTMTVQASTSFWQDRNDFKKAITLDLHFKKDITLDLEHKMTGC